MGDEDGWVAARGDDDFADLSVGGSEDGLLDVLEFDAKAAEFYLRVAVNAAEDLEGAVGAEHALVSGAVRLVSEGSPEELALSLLGVVQVPNGNTCTGNVDLAREPNRSRVQVFIDDVDGIVGKGSPSRNVLALENDLEFVGRQGTLGRAISVKDTERVLKAVRELSERLHQLGRELLATGSGKPPRLGLEETVCTVTKPREVLGRGGAGVSDLVIEEDLSNGGKVLAKRLRNDDEGPAVSEGDEDLIQRHVKPD